jgi:hypothetical protein
MKTLQQFNSNKEKITNAFLNKRDSAIRNFWCHTQAASDFYSYWDAKWNVIQNYFQKQWKEISAQC